MSFTLIRYLHHEYLIFKLAIILLAQQALGAIAELHLDASLAIASQSVNLRRSSQHV